MFGIPSTRIAELSRPEYPRDLAEYARLEYPREDARTVRLLALTAPAAATPLPRRRFRFFRPAAPHPEVVPAKA